MRLFRNPNITIAILAVYTAIMYAYLLPKNNEMTINEKAITVGSSCFILGILWYLLRKRDKLRREREEEMRNKKK